MYLQLIYIYLIYMYKQDLVLNNLQWLICHKTKPNQITNIIIIIIIIIIILFLRFFTPVFARGLSLQSEWQQVSSDLSSVFWPTRTILWSGRCRF